MQGTGKTLLARAMAKNVEANFMKVVASAIVDKYIGESARVIREMFGMLIVYCCVVSTLTIQCHCCHVISFAYSIFLYSGYAREHQPCIIFVDEIDASMNCF